MAGNLIKKPHSVALCSNPADKTQPNTWSPHTHPEHGLLDGSAKASPVPGSALGQQELQHGGGTSGEPAPGLEAGLWAFHRAMNEDAGKVGDEKEPGHCECLWFLEKGAQDWRHFAKPKQAMLSQ